MIHILLNSIALDPNRWSEEKIAYFRLDQFLDRVAKVGFHFIEVWQYHISRVTESEIRNYHEIADYLGLAFPVIGMYPALHFSGRGRQTELDKVERLFSYAKLLGADVVKTFVGAQGSGQISDSEYLSSVEFMQEILDLANSYDLMITGETHPDTLFDSIESCTKFRKAIDCESFKVCFQPFDFCSTEKAISDYRVLISDVIHVHYQGQKDGRMELLANSDLDYRKLTAELIKQQFSGKICIEFVKNCVVADPKDFDIKAVLENAMLDRDFIVNTLKESGTVDFVY